MFEFSIPPQRCSGCGALVRWVRTGSGKRMPVDAETAKPDDEVFDATRHMSHFATCKDASKFRRPR